MSTHLLVEVGETKKTLATFSPGILEAICEGAEVSNAALLNANSFNVMYSDTNVITSIDRNYFSYYILSLQFLCCYLRVSVVLNTPIISSVPYFMLPFVLPTCIRCAPYTPMISCSLFK